MGLFFNYDKPGKGIDKDAPKKKAPFLYIELLGRKFGKLLQANMLYFLTSLPVLIIYHFLIFSISASVLPSLEPDEVNHLSAMLATVLAILWGTGPVSAGFTYILRSFAREEHAWIVYDFFKKAKENFKYSLVFLLVDVAVFLLGTNAISFYFKLAQTNTIFVYVMFLVIICMTIYTFMHFYMYQFAVTFENSLREVYKNALIMALANMPMNLVLTALVVLCSYLVLGRLAPIGIILVAFLAWISMMRFPIDFYTTRVIKHKIIDARKVEESDE